MNKGYTQMGRPKLDPTFRFSDVAPYLHTAIQNNGLLLRVATRSRAVHIVHRLNLYRKVLRENADTPLIIADKFVFRAHDDGTVEIAPRPQPDFSTAQTLDGRSLADAYQPSIGDKDWRPTVTPQKLAETNALLASLGKPPITAEEYLANVSPIDPDKPLLG